MRRVLARVMYLVMLIFVILTLFTFSIWTFFPIQPIEVAFFAFLSLIEVLVLEIHNMAFSVPIMEVQDRITASSSDAIQRGERKLLSI